MLFRRRTLLRVFTAALRTARVLLRSLKRMPCVVDHSIEFTENSSAGTREIFRLRLHAAAGYLQ